LVGCENEGKKGETAAGWFVGCKRRLVGRQGGGRGVTTGGRTERRKEGREEGREEGRKKRRKGREKGRKDGRLTNERRKDGAVERREVDVVGPL
jgi:hypothetical protein